MLKVDDESEEGKARKGLGVPVAWVDGSRICLADVVHVFDPVHVPSK